MATKAIVGEKVGMTQVWDEQHKLVPVTVVRVAPLRIVQVKTTERDGYSAVQVTYGTRKARAVSKPAAGHFAKAGAERDLLLVRGAVPGPRGGLVLIRDAVKGGK